MKEFFKKKKPESIIFNPDSKYMIDFNKSEIETSNLMDYILNKKKEQKKLNLKQIYMFQSDIDEIRNTIDRNSTSYNTNYSIAGPEYVGADDQVYELWHKKYVSLPEKYKEYYKFLEDQFDDDPSHYKKDPIKNEKDNTNKTVKINKEIDNKKDEKSKIELNLIKNKNYDIENLKYKPKTPIKTYLGSNSGYNALSRPVLSAALIQRHNAHRNKERYNIEQVNIIICIYIYIYFK